jgi:predicted MPP superfamily phosphohydrolase
MACFLLLFFAIYGAMNSFCYWSLASAFPHLGLFRLVLAAWLALMVLGPLLVNCLDKWRCVTAASVLGAVTYLWMAVVFWFVVMGLAASAWNLAVQGVALAAPSARHALLPPAATVSGILATCLVLLVLGLIEAQDIRLHRITLKVPNLSRTVRLVQVSDLHLGLHTGPRRLAKTVELIREAAPDILVSTGDLVDGRLEHIEVMAAALADLRPPLGKFAVLGNHEFYNGVKMSLAFHEACGFRVLRGEWTSAGEALRIAGVDDPAGLALRQPCFDDEDAALPPARTIATLLLKHQPRAARGSLGRYDLQLSGHTHGGQIFPFHALTSLFYPLYRGRHDLAGGSRLYASLGAGTWGPPIRLFAPPEVTLFTLEPEEG